MTAPGVPPPALGETRETYQRYADSLRLVLLDMLPARISGDAARFRIAFAAGAIWSLEPERAAVILGAWLLSMGVHDTQLQELWRKAGGGAAGLGGWPV